MMTEARGKPKKACLRSSSSVTSEVPVPGESTTTGAMSSAAELHSTAPGAASSSLPEMNGHSQATTGAMQAFATTSTGTGVTIGPFTPDSPARPPRSPPRPQSSSMQAMINRLITESNRPIVNAASGLRIAAFQLMQVIDIGDSVRIVQEICPRLGVETIAELCRLLELIGRILEQAAVDKAARFAAVSVPSQAATHRAFPGLSTTAAAYQTHGSWSIQPVESLLLPSHSQAHSHFEFDANLP